MGTVHHHAIIVTTWDKAGAEAAHDEARRIFSDVTDICEASVNGYLTFFIPPDGSKEGWGPSDAGDERRDRFCEWLHAQRYEDGSNRFAWVEVGYGELGYRVTRHRERPKLNDPARPR
ncbi:MAG TPA: hypothetical protein VLT61_17545 [Anaeromyxobacteraceae bacterium]|nr:hypothetical protein [Anaeromyxobacteraceae bacterium]